MNIVKLVKRTISKDRAIAQRALENVALTPTLPPERQLSFFFPELESADFARRTNLPSGIQVPQYVVFGGQCIFDLEPLTPFEFQQKHGIDISTAVELVERKVLIPNLYVRSPNEWEGMQHMADLVKRSYVNGERVDAFMKFRATTYLSQDYPELLRKHEQALRRQVLASPEKHAELVKKTGLTLDRLPYIIARRWGYLDVISPAASREAEGYLRNDELVLLVRFISAAAIHACSRLTAAIGGSLVLGSAETQQVIDLFKDEPDIPSDSSLSPVGFLREELEYVTSRVKQTKPFTNFPFDGNRLLKFLDNDQDRAIRDRMVDLLDSLKECAVFEGNRKLEPTALEYQKIIKDYQERLSKYSASISPNSQGVGAAIGPSVGAAAGYAAGLLFPGKQVALAGIGAVVGNYASNALGSVADSWSNGLARRLSRFFYPKTDRVLVNLEKLERMCSK